MKKLLFTFLLAAIGLQGWADEYYLVGGCTDSGWNTGEGKRSAVRAYTADGTNWAWAGYISAASDADAGRFKIPNSTDGWAGFYAPAQNTVITSEGVSLSTDGTDDRKFRLAETGYYLITFNTSDMKIYAEKLTAPSKDGDYYLINSVSDYYYFAAYIATDATKNAKARLTADLSFEGKTFVPMASESYMFCGEFDGNGHTIDYAVVNVSYRFIGLFTYVTGKNDKTANIHDLVMGEHCSFTGSVKVGGIAGFARGGGEIKLTNIVNKANVTSTAGVNLNEGNTAGLIACATDGTKITALNCANTGTVTGQSGQCAAFAGWTQSGTTFTNCWNSGTINNTEGSAQLYRNSGAVEATNCYYLTGTSDQGTNKASSTLSSGELCYTLNGDQTTISWYQTIGTDDYPVPFSSHSRVYATGNVRCDGALLGNNTFTNDASQAAEITSHNYTDPSTGFCADCGAYEPNALSATDGWYEISEPWQLRWMAESVTEHNGTYGSANIKLTDNIDYSAYTDQAAMFGKPSNTFKGVFDGQNYTVTVAFVNNSAEETGLFRRINSGTVKNLKVDGTITTNQKMAGGICSGIWERGTIENCESAVTINDSGSGDATHGGILACVHDANDAYTINIHNCLFSGTLNASGRNGSAGIVGWTNNNNNVKVKNCLVTGTLTIADVNTNGVIARSTCDGENNYYTCSVGSNLKKDYATEASAKIETGELCYLLNERTSGGTNWTQTIDTDDNPVPFNTSDVVYANGEFKCDGVTPKEDSTTSYSNTEERTVDAHSFGANNLCSGCRAVGQAPSTSDSKYQIGTIGHLVWFSNYVNSGNTTANAVLTADIDQEVDEDVYAVYEPIGTEDNIYVGHFDGQGHTVNLALNNPDRNFQGLFGVVTDGVFIEKVVVTGYVNGHNYVGGIVGGTKGSNSGQKTNIWYCGNEAAINAANANGAGIIGVNLSGAASVIVTNCYNSGDITGTKELGAISGWLGDGKSSVRNCYNSGTVENPAKGFCRNGGSYFTNCYYTATCGTDNSTEDHANGQPAEVADDDVASGLLCAKLGYGFRQNLGTDTKPNFNVDHGFVSQIGDAGYSTMYNIHSDVTIPDGVEAYAGVINGDEWLHLDPITEKIKSSEPVILKLAEGTDAGFFNFMPTTGASAAESNDLQGSTGSVPGGSTIYALSTLGGTEEIGFYPTSSSIKIPEGRAYLNVPAAGDVKGFTFIFEDDETGIVSPLGETEEGVIYNLAGQRISKLQRGINIVNGKKVLK